MSFIKSPIVFFFFKKRFLANLIATVCILNHHTCKLPFEELTHNILQIFMLLNLNPIMSIIANVPAAIVSTVRISIALIHWRLHENLQQTVAGRVVRRLNNFNFDADSELCECVSIGKCTVP